MTHTENTPGPWENTPDTGEITDKNGIYIARAVLGSVTRQGKANARLIAAAPDLLEALERTLNFIANTESEMGEQLECGDMARAAIAKVRGQL